MLPLKKIFNFFPHPLPQLWAMNIETRISKASNLHVWHETNGELELYYTVCVGNGFKGDHNF